MEIIMTPEHLITAAACVSAFLGLLALAAKLHKWYLKQENQDRDIASMKQENCLLCYGLSAALDGLMQLGANHTVPLAKEKLDKYLNKQAHEQNRREEI